MKSILISKKQGQFMNRRSFLGLAPFAVVLPSTTFASGQTGHKYDEKILSGTYLNALDFGAKGNGIDDDTAALHDLLDAARENHVGMVFLPSGVYLISDTLRLSSGVRLTGAGREQTILQAVPGNLFPAFAPDPRTADIRYRRTMVTTESVGSVREQVVRGAGVTGLTIDWNGCPTDGLGSSCLLVDSADDFLVQDIDFIRCMPSDHPREFSMMSGSGFRSECVMFCNSRHGIMDRCLLTDSGYRPLSVAYGSRDITFKNSRIVAENPVWRHVFLEVHGDGIPRDERFVTSQLKCLNSVFILKGGSGQDGICCHTGSINVENCDFYIEDCGTHFNAVTRAFDRSKECVYKNNRFHCDKQYNRFFLAYSNDDLRKPFNNDIKFTDNILHFSFARSAQISDALQTRGLINFHSNVSRVAISNNAIHVRWGDTAQPVIRLVNTRNFSVDRNLMDIETAENAPAGKAILLQGCGPGHVQGNTARGAYTHGVQILDDANLLVVSGNILSEATEQSIEAKTDGDVHISNNL